MPFSGRDFIRNCTPFFGWRPTPWDSSFYPLHILLYSSFRERSGRRQPPTERSLCIVRTSTRFSCPIMGSPIVSSDTACVPAASCVLANDHPEGKHGVSPSTMRAYEGPGMRRAGVCASPILAVMRYGRAVCVLLCTAAASVRYCCYGGTEFCYQGYYSHAKTASTSALIHDCSGHTSRNLGIF